jgi:hypothetical protein
MVMLPLVIGAAWYLPARWLRAVGWGATGLGISAVVGVVLWVLLTWYPNVSETRQAYVVQRMLFTIATWIDVPIVQTTLAGITCWIVGSVRIRRIK